MSGPYLGGGQGGDRPLDLKNIFFFSINSDTQQLQVQIKEKIFSIDSAGTAATGANY